MRFSKPVKSIVMIATLFVFLPSAPQAQTGEPRLALVIGNAQYRNATPLATSANDAGLIAQTLTTAGFDVTGAADLDQDSMRRAFRDFLNKVQAAGPHAVTFVYLAGYGLQYAGDNYFVPVDATLARDTDIPVEAIRISDFSRALDGMPLDARIFVLDAARANPFPTKGNPLAGGLALVDVADNELAAFNAAPGTVATDQSGPYGVYARALAEMLRYGGVPLDEAFARARLRVNELTHGAFVPWDVSKLTRPLILLAGNPDASPVPAMENFQALRSRPIRDFPSANEAYAAAVELDTLSAYQEFLGAYPTDPLAGRVRALLAARREALTWNRTVMTNTPDAYWSYMRRYPRGPHYYDARRRLASFSVALEPPPRFNMYDFDGLPPPPQDEYVIVDRPVLIFDGPDYAPAPPPPAYFLPPPPPEFRRLPTPEQGAEGVLPAPIVLPLPFARPAQRLGNISQPNLTPASAPAGSGAPGVAPAGAPAIAPFAGTPPAGGPQRPAGAGPNALPVPQGTGQPAMGGQPGGVQPGVVQPGTGQPPHGRGGENPTPQAQPNALPATQGAQPAAGTPGATHPAGAAPNALPVPQTGPATGQTPPPAGGHRHPNARGSNAAAPVHPQTNAPAAPPAPANGPAVVPHVAPPRGVPHNVTPPVSPPAAPPHVVPQAVKPPVATPHMEAPRVAPPHPAPPPPMPRPAAAPPPVPHPAAAPPPAAPHPAAAPPHPAAPPAAAHPAPKPGEKPGEPPH